MAKEIKAKKFEVEVLFDPAKISTDPFSYKVDGVLSDDFKLTVDVPLGWFELTLQQGSGASFTTTPVQWVFNLAPISTPASFTVQRNNQLKITILNINRAGQEPQTFGFEIAVMYQGKTYTSPDPTIINVDPTQGVPQPLSGRKALGAPVAA